jgi:hypothetical protein
MQQSSVLLCRWYFTVEGLNVLLDPNDAAIARTIVALAQNLGSP